MAFPATKGNMFVVYSLDPFKVVMKNTYRVRQGFGQMHMDADSSIGSVPSIFCFLRYFDENPQPIPISVRVSSSQYSRGREYRRIQTGAQLKSSLSG